MGKNGSQKRGGWVAVAATILSLGASPALAVDGVIEINQAAALAGGITPCDAPGFPVTISQPGSYRLTSNLIVPDAATNGIQITANDVTLDLNGFSIIGPNTCTPNPVRCTFSGGGIGVMAIMSISVTERTREIGVRKALGARRSEILFQFLMEAAFLTSLGGILGVILGSGIGWGVHLITGFPISLPWWSYAIGLGFSASVGIFFGMWPAVKASRLDPIEALRYE